jgi:acetyltransferase-like isoleucine patch superfamily enzyme
MVRYNAALGASDSDRHSLLVERFAAVGKDVVIRPPFHCDYGYNIRLGDGVFLNFNCIILDVAAVTIGAGTQMGPAVQMPAPSLPTGSATSSRACSPAMCSFGRSATALGLSAVPTARTTEGSAGPRSRMMSDGLSGAASIRITISSAAGSGTGVS